MVELETGFAKAFGFGNQMVSLLFWLFVLALVGAIIYFIIYIFSFKVKVIIKEKVGAPFDVARLGLAHEYNRKNEVRLSLQGEVLRAEGKELRQLEAIPTKTRTYNGKIVRKNGKYHLKMFTWFTKPFRLKIPDSLYVNMGLKGTKRIEFLKLSQHFYAPIITVYDKNIFEKAHFEDSFVDWLVGDIEDDKAKYHYEGWLAKYGQYLAMAGVLAIMLIMLIIVFKYSQDLANTNAQATQVLVNAIKDYSQSCAQTL